MGLYDTVDRPHGKHKAFQNNLNLTPNLDLNRNLNPNPNPNPNPNLYDVSLKMWKPHVQRVRL